MRDYIITFQDGSEAYLVHHGIKGQKWGVRKYQNEDGTYTEEGRRRYLDKAAKLATGAAVAVGLGKSSKAAYTLGKAGQEYRKGIRFGARDYLNNEDRDVIYGGIRNAGELGVIEKKARRLASDDAANRASSILNRGTKVRDVGWDNYEKAMQNKVFKRYESNFTPKQIGTRKYVWDTVSRESNGMEKTKEILSDIKTGASTLRSSYGKEIKTGAIIAGSALAAYGAYKLGTKIADNKKEKKNKEG